MIRFRILLLHEDIKKQASKIAHDQPNFFFSTDNLRKISAILIISSIKMAPALLPYIILYRANLCVSFYIYISISMHTSQLNSIELVQKMLEGAYRIERTINLSENSKQFVNPVMPRAESQTTCRTPYLIYIVKNQQCLELVC